MGQADFFQHEIRIKGVAADFRSQLNVFTRGQVLHKVVKLKHKPDIIPPVAGQFLGIETADNLAVQHNGALIAGIHTAEHIEHRCFTGPRGAQDYAEFPAFNRKLTWSAAAMRVSPI